MSQVFANIPLGSVLPIFFSAYGKTNGESLTISNFATSDIQLYKGTAMTQRASVSGFTMLGATGIDVDGLVGIHGFSIDTNDNTDAGFYSVGSFYTAVVASITVDGQVINFVAATFRLLAAENTSGVPVADAVRHAGTTQTTGDLVALLNTVAGKTNALPAAPAAVADIPTAIQNADALLKRDFSLVTGEASRSPLNALRFLRNKWTIIAGALSVKKEDDTAVAWTGVVTTAPGDPANSIDPT
mgnify:CR=1 FL=1